MQSALFTKGHLLRIVALVLLMHDGPAANPVMHQAVSGLVQTLLLHNSNGGGAVVAGGALRPEAVVVSVLGDLAALSACNLSTWWQQQVCLALLSAPVRDPPLTSCPAVCCADGCNLPTSL